MRLDLEADKFSTRIETMSRNNSNLSGLNKKFSLWMLNDVRNNLSKGKDIHGKKFEPLKNSKRQPLIGFLGTMRAKADKNSATVYNTKEYFQFHQTGNDKLPRRQSIPIKQIPSKWAEHYSNIYKAHIKGASE